MKPPTQLCLLIVTGEFPPSNWFKKEQFHPVLLDDLPPDVRDFIASPYITDHSTMADKISEFLLATNFFQKYSTGGFPFQTTGARLFGVLIVDNNCMIHPRSKEQMSIKNNKQVVCALIKEKFGISPGNIYPKEFASW
jgi:hypothetical protein